MTSNAREYLGTAHLARAYSLLLANNPTILCSISRISVVVSTTNIKLSPYDLADKGYYFIDTHNRHYEYAFGILYRYIWLQTRLWIR